MADHVFSNTGLKESSDGETLIAVDTWFQSCGAAEEKAQRLNLPYPYGTCKDYGALFKYGTRKWHQWQIFQMLSVNSDSIFIFSDVLL